MSAKNTSTSRAKPPRETPIVAEDGLYLFAPYLFDGMYSYLKPRSVIAKFVRCFRKAWSQIPETDRRTLQDYWRSDTNGPGGMRRPLIGFNLLAHCDTACCALGYQLDFNASYVDYTKPKTLVCVIAHELGHAISFPHGWSRQHECVGYGGVECVACECRASSYVAGWGFDVALVTPLVFHREPRR